MRGVVRYFKEYEGWGVAYCDELKEDVWIHFSVICGSGPRSATLHAGEQVEMEVEAVPQDHCNYRATSVSAIQA